jgi:two-component system sensor histidine kinase AtoS
LTTVTNVRLPTDMPDTPQRPQARAGRRTSAAAPSPPAPSPAAPRLDAEDRFFRHIVSSMRNGVIAVRRDGTLMLMNAEAYRIFSLTPQPDDIGRPFADVLRTRADIVRVLTAAFELSHLPNRAELRLKELDRVIGYTLSQVRDDGADRIGAVMFFKDLTQVEQMEERERLRDRLASLGEMAAGIAHELKNPLAGIEVMAGLLRRQVPDSVDAQSLLADIISEAKLANAIVVEMLEFVRPIRLQVEHTNIADVLHQAMTLAESKAARGGVSVTLDVAQGLPPVECDHYQLCQVFTNLIANAFEALDGKGAITIAASLGAIEPDPAFASAPQDPTPIVIVDVADNGPGVPAELNDRIFDPFFTTKLKGTGLGLGIVRKIVDAHDGRIDLSSSKETGTRFRVTLPVTSATGVFR